MRKKLFIFSLLSIILIIVGVCSYNNTKKQSKLKVNTDANGGAEIAMLIDLGNIDDKSFKQGIFDTVSEFAQKNGKTYNYYIPEEKSDYSVTKSIEKAIDSGAKIIVAPGYWFKRPIDLVQHRHKDVKFIIIDTTPYCEDIKMYTIAENTVAILFSDQEAGYLAGYAVVMEGFKNIGFMGGIKLPSVENFGYGYIQGINDAAKKKGLGKKSIKLKYTYLGSFEESAEHEYVASSWFAGDIQVIFACAGQAGLSVMKSAEKYKDKYVVGVDIDQSSQSEKVITSAIKDSKRAVYEELEKIYGGNFKGGKYAKYEVKDGYIYLEMKNARFKNFSKEQYDELVREIKDGNIQIKKINSDDKNQIKFMDFDYVTVDFQD
ncbi:basic membrane protein [Peptostreptococcaceae bacterium AS15]|nr:basic membrane protein [Peptostreptococcaceae bacterium AS15]